MSDVWFKNVPRSLLPIIVRARVVSRCKYALPIFSIERRRGTSANGFGNQSAGFIVRPVKAGQPVVAGVLRCVDVDANGEIDAEILRDHTTL